MSYIHGVKAKWNPDTRKWYYLDGEVVRDNNYRACPKCGEKPTAEGHDACIANLPDVKFACCGHGLREKGEVDYGYIYFESGEVIRDSDPNFDRIVAELKKKRDSLTF